MGVVTFLLYKKGKVKLARVINIPSGGFNALTVSEFVESVECRETILCLSEREKTVIRKGLEALRWPTRYGEYVSPTRFKLSDNTDVINVINGIEAKMSCNDISNSLDNLGSQIRMGLEAIARSQCCKGTELIVNVNGGINGSLSNGEVTYGTNPYSDAQVTLPDGYESVEQYKAQKCSLANAMADGIIAMLYGLDTIATFNAIGATTVFILGTIGILVIPEVVIPALIAAISIAWLASGSLYALAQEVENRKEELICILYTTDTPSTAISLVADFFDVAIAALSFSSPVAIALKTILMIAVNEATLSQLYDKYAGFMYPSANCDDCEPVVLSVFNQAMGHRDMWGGQEYGATQENVNYALGDIDGLKAHFNGSYYLDVCYDFNKLVSAGTQIYLTYELLHSSVVGVYVNSESGTLYTSAGWTQQSLTGNSFVASQDCRSVLIKVYGDSGYNSDILLDAITG